MPVTFFNLRELWREIQAFRIFVTLFVFNAGDEYVFTAAESAQVKCARAAF